MGRCVLEYKLACMPKRPPMFLNVCQIRFPVTALVSILHRLSGVGLFLLLPALLWVWQSALNSEATFQCLQHCWGLFWVKGLAFLFLVGLCYHIVAGGRHLCMDMGWGESKRGGRFGAYLVLVLTLLFTGWLAYRFWGQ